MISPGPERRPRILIIDDDPLFRSLLTSLLRETYEVIAAGDGEEGYHKALDTPPDAAIVDVQMPGWDGLKTLKAMRDNPTLAQLPVMMLTSDASQKTVLTAIHAGATDYLLKSSFSKDEYLKKLDHLIGLSEPQQQEGATGVLATAARATGGTEPCVVESSTQDGNADIQELLDAWE